MRNLKFNGQRIVSGPGSLECVKDIAGKRVFIITGKSAMFKNGTIDKLEQWFDETERTYAVYPGIGANPSKEEVLTGAQAMKAFEPDTVLAVGGGSAIDAAKVMTLLCDVPALTIEAIREGHAPGERSHIMLIAAPSTSGTASEVTRAAVITFQEENIKVGLKTEAFIPDVAILDGNLTLSMPEQVMVETGMDALTHAIESFINKNNDDFCKNLSKIAVEGLCQWLPVSFEKGDIESRQHVHNFQCIAGMAFQNSGLGMDHGIAHAFGGRFGTSHGLLNAVALPYVMKYNQRDAAVAADFETLSRLIGDDIIAFVEKLNRQFGVPATFQEMGITEAVFKANYDLLLANSMKGSTVRNPVPMTEEAMDRVLQSIYYGNIRF